MYEKINILIDENMLPKPLIEDLGEYLSSNFQSFFVVELNSLADITDSEKWSLEYGLDLDNGSIALNIYSAFKNTDLLLHALNLGNHFWVIQRVEKLLNENLSNIDALLGCPITIPKVYDGYASVINLC